MANILEDGILNTNTEGQRREAEAPCTQLGGLLIGERFANPVERGQIPERKECGNQRAVPRLRLCWTLLPRMEHAVLAPATFQQPQVTS